MEESNIFYFIKILKNIFVYLLFLKNYLMKIISKKYLNY
jgi:hypothetical protein